MYALGDRINKAYGNQTNIKITTREDIDVSKIAQAFGGGGHKKAAGFEMDGHLEFKNGEWKILR